LKITLGGYEPPYYWDQDFEESARLLMLTGQDRSVNPGESLFLAPANCSPSKPLIHKPNHRQYLLYPDTPDQTPMHSKKGQYRKFDQHRNDTHKASEIY